MPAGIGHGQAVEGMIGDAAHDGIVGVAVGEADDAGGKGEQVEQPDHRQQGKQPKDIRLRLVAARCVISPTAIATSAPATSSTSTIVPRRRSRLMHRHRLGRRIEV